MTEIGYVESDSQQPTNVTAAGVDIEDLASMTVVVDEFGGPVNVELVDPTWRASGASVGELLIVDAAGAVVEGGGVSRTFLPVAVASNPSVDLATLTARARLDIPGTYTLRGRARKNGGGPSALSRGGAPAFMRAWTDDHDPSAESTIVSTRRAGRFTAGVKDVIIRPRSNRPGRPLIIYGHGAGGNASEALWMLHLLRRVAVDCDAVIVVPSTTNQYGSSAAMMRDDAAVVWAAQKLGATGPIGAIGCSGGALKSLSRAWQAPPPAFVVGIIPALDLRTVYAREAWLAPSIAAAYGVQNGQSLPPGVSPFDHFDLLARIPQQHWYSPPDSISVNWQQYAEQTGAEMVDVGPAGHDIASMLAVDPDRVVDFIRSVID